MAKKKAPTKKKEKSLTDIIMPEVEESEELEVIEEPKRREDTFIDPPDTNSGLWIADAALAESFDRGMHKRIYSHFTELFMMSGPFLGKKTAIFGDAHKGKSTLSYRQQSKRRYTLFPHRWNSRGNL